MRFVPPASDASLVELSANARAWIDHDATHGHTNAGVIIDDDGLTVIDCLLTPARAEALVEAVADLERPIRRVVYSTSHIEFVGGSSKLWMAARYGRPQTSALLDQPPNVGVYRHLYPTDADSFDDEFTTRPVSHMVNEAAWLTPSVCALPVTGQQRENLVAFAPEADALFAGAMAVFGVTPNCFDGDPLAWADALGDLTELGIAHRARNRSDRRQRRRHRAPGVPVRVRRCRWRHVRHSVRAVGQVA